MKLGFIQFLKKVFLGVGQRSARPVKESSAQPFKGETSVLQPAYTVRLKPDPRMDQTVSDGNPAPEQKQETSIAWCALTDTGRVRTRNEDYFCCAELEDGTLFVVADGMGGHDAGDVASRLAGETVSRIVREKAPGAQPEKVLEQAVQQANLEVLAEAGARGSNMGTTITAALIGEDRACIANVGDSRTYWIENGSIRRITADHSLVEKLVSLGKMTREEAREHPKSNVLYRTVGSESPLAVDLFTVPLRKGGSLLLCSDGLWGEVPDEAIHRMVSGGKNVKKTCANLVKTANENGGKDNITAIVVKVV